MHGIDLEEAIRPLVAALGYELWGLELSGQGRRTVLRVYIDSDQGIGVEDCSAVSNQVSSLLDVEEPIHGAYTLEVSSPGLDRGLYTLEQCRRYSGQRVKMRLREAFEGQRNFTGILAGVENQDLVVRTAAEEELLLPYTSVERINLAADAA